MTDFSKTLIRASAFGMIMTEPKEAKNKGGLSKTAKSYLINTYIKAKYDREKDINTKQMQKGKENEPIGIQMLSIYTGKILEKNDTRLSNDYFTGEPDIFEGESIDNADFIWDTKLSYDIWTFIPNVLEPLDKAYFFQLQAYFSLCNCQEGAIAYVLTDASERQITEERFNLLRRMNVATELDPEYIEEAAKMEINMIYPDIPLEEKILIFKVKRDDEIIEKMQQKVIKCREYLQELEQKHLNFNKS